MHSYWPIVLTALYWLAQIVSWAFVAFWVMLLYRSLTWCEDALNHGEVTSDDSKMAVATQFLVMGCVVLMLIATAIGSLWIQPSQWVQGAVLCFAFAILGFDAGTAAHGVLRIYRGQSTTDQVLRERRVV